MFQHIVTAWQIDRGCSRMLEHYFIIPWHHVLSCTNMAVNLSWWFQQHCPNLFVHQAMNSLFQHAWISLSTTMFKLASSTMFIPVNRQKQAVRFYLCRCKQRNVDKVAQNRFGLIFKHHYTIELSLCFSEYYILVLYWDLTWSKRQKFWAVHEWCD